MSYALIINDKHNNIDCFVKDGGWEVSTFWDCDDDFRTTPWRRDQTLSNNGRYNYRHRISLFFHVSVAAVFVGIERLAAFLIISFIDL